MRKFFPLKQVSGPLKSSEGVECSAKDDSRRNSTASQERKGSNKAHDEHSLYCEISSRNSSPHVRRQHWCPTCSHDSGTRCNTPPSCDENLSAAEGNYLVLDSSKRLLSLDGIGSSHTQEECVQTLTKSPFRSSRNPFHVNVYSNESGRKGPAEALSKTSLTPLFPPRSAGDLKAKRKNTSNLRSNLPKVPDTEIQRFSLQRFLNESKQSSYPRNEFLVKRETSDLPPLDLQSGTSRAGSSIMLQPRSYSFSGASSFRDKCFDGAERSSINSVCCVNSEEDGTQMSVSSSASSKHSLFKNPSARDVAERLAKAIRGSSNFSSKIENCSSLTNETKIPVYEVSQMGKHKEHSNPFSNSHERRRRGLSECSTSDNAVSCMSPSHRGGFDHVHENKSWPEQTTFLLHQDHLSDGSSEKGSLREIHVDKCHGMGSEEHIKLQNWIANTKDQCGQEGQHLSKRLEGFLKYFDSSIEVLQDKIKSVEERAVNIELENIAVNDVILKTNRLRSSEEGFNKAVAAKLLETLPKIREVQEEKGSLALEVAAELRQRIVERDFAKRVMGLMKTATDLYIKASIKEQQEFTSAFDAKLETRQVESLGLRERIHKLEEEKAVIQNDLTLVSSRESALGEKVKNFEALMEGHKERVEEAEKVILQLQKASANAQKQIKQSEEELEVLKKSTKVKEEENLALYRSLTKLQQLGLNQEKRHVQIERECINRPTCTGKELDYTAELQLELQKLKCSEKTLQKELQASQIEANFLRYQVRDLEEKLKNQQENSCMMKCALTMGPEADSQCLGSPVALDSEKLSLAKESTAVFQSSNRRELIAETKGDLKKVPVLGKCLLKEGIAEGESKAFHASSIGVDLQQCPDEKKNLDQLRKEYQEYKTSCHPERKDCSSKQELEFLRDNYQALSWCLTDGQSKNNVLNSLLNNMHIKMSQLEDKLREREESIKLLQHKKDENTQEISRLRTELSLVQKERDDMQKQAEVFGREALRMSAQVEVLRRKANQLEEDVLLKEGQISILKGSYEACDQLLMS